MIYLLLYTGAMAFTGKQGLRTDITVYEGL